MVGDRLLSEGWRFLPDPYEHGVALGYPKPEFDDGGWTRVNAPHVFPDHGPSLEGYDGVGWYRIWIDGCSDSRVIQWVEFDGVFPSATIYADGNEIFSQPDALLPFAVPLPTKDGRILLAIRITGSRKRGKPGPEGMWRPEAGVVRPVRLAEKSVPSIRALAPEGDTNGNLRVRIRMLGIADHATACTLTIRLLDVEGNPLREWAATPAMVVGDTQWEASYSVKVKAWSPDSPQLYLVEASLKSESGVSVERKRMGFRTIQARGDELFLNGEPIRLLGFNHVEDTPENRNKPDPEAARRDLSHMKSLGANFVRLRFHPHDTSTLDLCDELGLLAMVEAPIDGHSVPEANFEAAGRALTAMIERDRAHPSVIVWSVSDEAQTGSTSGVEKLVRLAKSLDPSRLCAHVSAIWAPDREFSADDLICVSAYPSLASDSSSSQTWWSERLTQLHEKLPGRPILISGFGHPGLFGIAEGSVGESAQLAALKANARSFGLPYVCGAAIWCYADHRWLGPESLRSVDINPFGFVSQSRVPKAAIVSVSEVFDGLRIEPSIPNEHVRMLRPDLKNLPTVLLPSGYSIRGYETGDSLAWTRIQRAAEEYQTISDDLFVEQFGTEIETLRERCFFVIDPEGLPIGTVSAWWKNQPDGESLGRIHWVAIDPDYQGQGLGKAALSFALIQLARWHSRAFLSTSTARIPAIGMYLNFGFEPWIASARDAQVWKRVAKTLNHPALHAYLD